MQDLFFKGLKSFFNIFFMKKKIQILKNNFDQVSPTLSFYRLENKTFYTVKKSFFSSSTWSKLSPENKTNSGFLIWNYFQKLSQVTLHVTVLITLGCLLWLNFAVKSGQIIYELPEHGLFTQFLSTYPVEIFFSFFLLRSAILFLYMRLITERVINAWVRNSFSSIIINSFLFFFNIPMLKIAWLFYVKEEYLMKSYLFGSFRRVLTPQECEDKLKTCIQDFCQAKMTQGQEIYEKKKEIFQHLYDAKTYDFIDFYKNGSIAGEKEIRAQLEDLYEKIHINETFAGQLSEFGNWFSSLIESVTHSSILQKFNLLNPYVTELLPCSVSWIGVTVGVVGFIYWWNL